MSTPLQPRGPLPARVYWTRRVLVLAVALLLVVGVSRLLSSGSDASSEADGQATTVSSEESAPFGDAAPESTETEESGEPDDPEATASDDDAPDAEKKQPAKKRTKEPLPAPTGECEPSDITVQPVVRKANAGQDVTIKLRLRTEEAEACTWEVSPETLTMKITSGSDDIWFSSECPREIPTEDVVLRSETGTSVEVVWDARRSDEDCSRYTDWAMPGDYHVIAAALAGEPTDLQFSLEQAVSQTITKTVTPKPRPKKSSSGDAAAEDSEKRSGKRPGKQRERTQHRAGDDGGGNSDG